MNTIINEITQAGKFGAPAGNEVHWTFDWYQPLKPNTGSGNNSNGTIDPKNSIPSANSFLLGGKDHSGSRTNLNRSSSNLFQLENGRTEGNVAQQNNGDDDTVERYPFKVKAWLKSQQSAYSALDLEENNTLNVLDLNGFDRTKISFNKDQTKIALEKNKRVDGDGLTEKDIRGAVAGSGSIPGLSSSDNQTTVTEDKNKTEQTAASSTSEPPKQDISTDQVSTTITENRVTETTESTKEIEPTETSVEASVEASVEPSIEISAEKSLDPSVEPSVAVSETPVGTPSETPTNVDKEGDIEMKE